MKKIIFFLFILGLSITGCQTVVDADNLLDTEEKVYIVGYLSPSDTILTVNVSKALSVIGTQLSTNNFRENENLFLIKDAVVLLSNAEGNQIQLNYSEERLGYITDATNLPILEGNQYFLEVMVEEKNFTSSCRIPQKIEAIVEQVDITVDDGSRIAIINIGFNDLVGNRNFYLVGGSYSFIFDGDVFTRNLFFETGGFITDAIQDGLLLGDEAIVFIGNPSPGASASLKLQVAHLEEILYNNLRASYLNRNNDGNPLAEISIAPDNIDGEGGIGVFAGYQLTEKVIEIQF